MQATHQIHHSCNAVSYNKAQTASGKTPFFVTPPKNTKPCNLSPGKKPSMRAQVAAGVTEVNITPFNLLLSL